MPKINNDWYLGLDIGTNSVGWCASDIEYNILTKGGKLQCGSRLFESAKDASERRGYRSSRRRFARRKVRVDLLQALFDSEIAKKDNAFFIRMNASNLQDDTGKGLYPLFLDHDFHDSDYYKNFPTIYHLRKHLLENDEKDIRLLYLACHHLIKYRGHFLFNRFNASDSSSGYDEIYIQLGTTDLDSLRANKGIDAALKGNKIDLKKIFTEDADISEKLADIKESLTKDYNFKSEKFEEIQEIANTVLDDEQIAYILALKSLYDRIQLDNILNGDINIPSVMVNLYDEHKSDLKLLKKFIRQNLPDEYDKMFRQNGIYSNYVKSNLTHNKKTLSHNSMCKTEITTITYDEFLKAVDKVIEEAKDSENYQILKEKIKEKINEKTLCKIQNTQDNAYIPYQLQESELRAILERQRDNFPFLQNTDEYGSVADKIISLLTFRIPYYVGPLSEKDKGKFAWIEKNKGYENERVLPWNFEKTVNTAASGEAFIRKMTAKCTYLRNEDVIPKQSLLYQRYMLLCDLNNIKINGNRITQELKLLIYNGICQKETKLSKTKIKNFLIEQGKITKSDSVGKETQNDAAFNSSLSSQIKFKEILGGNFNEEMCENIIMWHTVFGDEKKPIVLKIKELYGDRLSQDRIEKLGKLSFTGWARFSAKFLNGITATDKATGETAQTIIKLLENTPLNLMELLNSDSYFPKFLKTVESENMGDTLPALDYDGLIKDLYCSPTVKRSIWQAILICKELQKINKAAPKKVFIEVTRGEDKKQKGKMKSSRKTQVINLLNTAVKDSAAITSLLSEINKKTEQELRSDRLYLYFTQLGKCMYSGEKIDLAQLNNESLYDIDHIYPQSKIKDDSLTNRVLVKKDLNILKGNAYPLQETKIDISKETYSFWEMLKNKGLINNEKYSRLISSAPLSEEMIGGFINRQLVSTNQAVKETKNALKLIFGDDTKIVDSKAGNVSEFRHTYDLIKCREVNNLHHAHDAYLNIVVGNVWDNVYSDYWNNNRTLNEDRALDKLFKTDRIGVWKTAYIQNIKDYIYDNKKFLNKYLVTFCPYEKKGAFYDQTIHPKGKAQFDLHKGHDRSKYGGYKTGCNAYNCVIEYDGIKGKRIRGIFPVPIRYIGMYEGDELVKQITDDRKHKNPKLIIKRILVDAVLEEDGLRYLARTGDLQCPALIEWYPNEDIIQMIRDIVKCQKLVKEKQITIDSESTDDIIFASRERGKNQRENKKIGRESNLKVYVAIIEQIKKPFYAKYSFAKKIIEGKISREKFENLPTYEQAEQLIVMLNAITFNGKNFDALKIGGVKNETPIYKISDIYDKNISLITQSVTGLFENRVIINVKNG